MWSIRPKKSGMIHAKQIFKKLESPSTFYLTFIEIEPSPSSSGLLNVTGTGSGREMSFST